MKCLTFRHWKSFLTLSLLNAFFGSLTTFASDSIAKFGLPNELTVKVGAFEVKGFLGDPRRLKESAAEDPSVLPSEGFLYRIEPGLDSKIEIAVWSISNQESKIMSAAEKKLSELIYTYMTQKGEEPAGFFYARAERTKYGKEKRIERSPAVPNLNPVLAGVGNPVIPPVVAPTKASTAPLQAPLEAKVEAGQSLQAWRFSTSTFYWVLVALAVLVGVAWGKRLER